MTTPDYDDALWEARLEAAREDASDRFDEVAETCITCGERWDAGVHPPTRWEPAWAERPECPKCGSGPVSQCSREEVSERLAQLEEQQAAADERSEHGEADAIGHLIELIERAR